MMMTQSLTDRYVDAAVRGIPAQQRDDVARELRGSIDDQVDARVAAGQPVDEAEREVLVGLGDPARLAADLVDRPLQLIGPRYYLVWLRLLRLLLWIVLPCVAAALTLAGLLARNPGGEIVGSVVSTTFAVAIHLAFWTTLSFALLERFDASGPEPVAAWSVDDLPELPQPGAGLGETVGRVALVLLGILALAWDQFVGLVRVGGETLPFFDPARWPWLLLVGLVLLVEGVLALVVHRAGRRTVPHAAVATVLGVLVAVPALWLIAQGVLVNPEVVEALFRANADLTRVLSAVAGVSIAAVTVWDLADVWRGALRSRRSR